MINIRKALADALHQLAKSDEAVFEAELLLCHVLGKNRAYLFAHPEAMLDATIYEQYLNLIKRRATGVPIAYITGMREFWSLPLVVNEHTLIPRHETERLVELALELIPNEPNTTILELGTGSGAIACALAKERPHWHIVACDLSKEALSVAEMNAKRLGIETIEFIHSNWFSKIPQIKYHAIVSNPPYIAEHDPHLNQGDLCFEPFSALASSQDGLADLQYIVEQSIHYLLPNRLLLLEHGYDQKICLSTILNKLGYKKTQCWQDIQGHDRVSGGWRP